MHASHTYVVTSQISNSCINPNKQESNPLFEIGDGLQRCKLLNVLGH